MIGSKEKKVNLILFTNVWTFGLDFWKIQQIMKKNAAAFNWSCLFPFFTRHLFLAIDLNHLDSKPGVKNPSGRGGKHQVCCACRRLENIRGRSRS